MTGQAAGQQALAGDAGNWPVPGLGISFLARRARFTWQLLACVAVTVLLATGLAAALWTFAAEVIPLGARSVLAASQDRSIGLSGVRRAGQAITGAREIRARLRAAWPGIGYQMESALWSSPILLRSPRAVRAEPSPVLISARQSTGRSRSGRWPESGPDDADGRHLARSAAPRQPAPGALPAAVASQLHVRPGSVLTAATRWGPAAAGLRITGLFRPKNPASPYWALNQVPVSGFAANHPRRRPGSPITYGPAVVSPAAFGNGLATRQVSWFVLPPALVMARRKIGALSASTSQAVTNLTTLIHPPGCR